MTAEIAALNKHGVALASDSAVTITHQHGDKVFNSANKLFALSKFAPVGIMIYGDASFMNVPWEPLIKTYRSNLKNRRFETIEGYATDFKKFVETNRLFASAEVQRTFLTRRLIQQFWGIRGVIDGVVQQWTYDKHGEMTPDLMTKLVDRVIEKQEARLAEYPRLGDFPKRLITKNARLVAVVRTEVFSKIPLTPEQQKRLDALIGFLCLIPIAYIPSKNSIGFSPSASRT